MQAAASKPGVASDISRLFLISNSIFKVKLRFPQVIVRSILSIMSENSVKNEHHEALGRTQTIGGVSMSPELFEQLYLAPKNPIKGQLRQTFGNPTPIGE